MTFNDYNSPNALSNQAAKVMGFCSLNENAQSLRLRRKVVGGNCQFFLKFARYFTFFKISVMEKERARYVHAFKASNFFSIKDIEMSELGGRREIYLLGENGDGKSLILMALVIAFRGHFIEKHTERKETGAVIDMVRSNPDLILSGNDDQGNAYRYPGKSLENNGGEEESLSAILAYGVHRSRNDSSRSDKWGFMTLFDDNQYLTSPEEWLKMLYTAELEGKVQSSLGRNVNLPTVEEAKKILVDLLDQNVEIEVSAHGVRYLERGVELRFSQLSEGYKSVLTWVCDMISRLAMSGHSVAHLGDHVGVVLVDEINLHLHPKWERQIVRKLRGWFPNIQFFFTTHSPVTILGASDDAVFYRVYKEKGETKLSEPYHKSDWKDLMANNIITSPLFGLADARMESGETARASLDTSKDFLHSRIHQKISERLDAKKKEGRVYFSPAEIDQMIEKALNEELYPD